MPRPPHLTTPLSSPAGYQPLTFVFFLLTFPLVVAVKSWAVLGTVLLCRQAWQPGAASCRLLTASIAAWSNRSALSRGHDMCRGDVAHACQPTVAVLHVLSTSPSLQTQRSSSRQTPLLPFGGSLCGASVMALQCCDRSLLRWPRCTHSRRHTLVLCCCCTSLRAWNHACAPFSALYCHDALLSPIRTALRTLCTAAASVPPPQITHALARSPAGVCPVAPPVCS